MTTTRRGFFAGLLRAACVAVAARVMPSTIQLPEAAKAEAEPEIIASTWSADEKWAALAFPGRRFSYLLTVAPGACDGVEVGDMVSGPGLSLPGRVTCIDEYADGLRRLHVKGPSA